MIYAKRSSVWQWIQSMVGLEQKIDGHKKNGKKDKKNEIHFHYGLQELTGSSFIDHCIVEEGCDLPDVQLIFNVSPIWYWFCSPLICGPSLGKSVPSSTTFAKQWFGNNNNNNRKGRRTAEAPWNKGNRQDLSVCATIATDFFFYPFEQMVKRLDLSYAAK